MGEVYSFAITRIAPPGFEGHVPFIVTRITLAEGVRMMANVIDCAPEDVRIGMKVRLAWQRCGCFNLPVFRPE